MSKLPSGRFPFINLTKAIERARAIFDNDKGGKGLQMPVAFAAWGYSDKSSGGFQTVSALKQYGLVDDEGSKEDRSVVLTESGRTYFLTEIDADKANLRDEFARAPQLFAHLLEHWGGGTVEDAVARTYLKTSLGMNEQSARSALGIYKSNLTHLKDKAVLKPFEQIGEIGDSLVDEDDIQFGGARVGDYVDWESNGVVGNAEPMKVVGISDNQAWVFVEESDTGLPMDQVIVRSDIKSTPRTDAPANPFKKAVVEEDEKIAEGYRSEMFDTDEGKVTISWPSDLSAQSVEDMKDWLKLLERRIERRASGS